MSTAMSTKRVFLAEHAASKPALLSTEAHVSLYALVAGILLLVVGGKADFASLMIIGFFLTASAGLALNSLFWAHYFAKHGEPKFHHYSRY